MYSRPELLLHFALTALVILAGLQDWRKREVSNCITIPLFALGFSFVILRTNRLEFLPMLVSVLLATAWTWKWMGGADVKILIGLWGLWPAAGFMGLIAAAIWGLALMLIRKGRNRFPAVTAIAIGVFSFLVLFFITQ